MKKIFYNKLIRDRIPQNIKEAGSDFEIKKLSAADFEKELRKKLIEEASEVAETTSKIELSKELGDVLDIIEELRRLKKIPLSAIKRARRTALSKKGGFRKKLFLIWSSDDRYKKTHIRDQKR